MSDSIDNSYEWEYLNDTKFNPMYEEVANMITHFGSKHVLDLGCGYSRINEFLPSTIRIDGVDNNDISNAYCNENWLGKYSKGDVFNIKKLEHDNYDCILLSGLMYYIKPGKVNGNYWGFTPESYIDALVEKFNPKHIIIVEPMPSKSYKSPDYSTMLDQWAWVAGTVSMDDVRMGERTIYTLFTDKKRPERKVKAEFNDDSQYDHQEQQDFDESLLKHWVYILNTEEINSERDGLIRPSTPDINQYVGVSAGYKLMYKACIDWYPGKQMHFMYIDVVQQALDYRMFIDKNVGLMQPQDLLAIYKQDINDKILPYPENAIDIANDAVRDQLRSLNIPKSTWEQFLVEYRSAQKTYVKIDAVNNIKLFSSILNTQEPTWFWYSNIHDWHQFRFTSSTFDNWCRYLTERNTQLKLVGKTPPFTSD